MGQDGHTVVFLDPKAGQGIGRAVGGGFQLGIGQGQIPEDDGRLVGVVVGRAAHHVGDYPPVDPVVAVHQEFEVFLVQKIEARFFLVGHRLGTGRHGRSSAGLDGINAAGESPASREDKNAIMEHR